MKRDTLKMSYLVHKSAKSGYKTGECYALNALGTFFRNISHYDDAITMHTRALRLARELEDVEMEVLSLNMLGVVYRRMDAIRSALDYHKEALDLAETQSPPSLEIERSIAVSQNSMGNIYLALKQYDLALEQFQKSLKIETRLDNRLGLAINNHNIGYAKEKQGLIDEALQYYQQSLVYNNEINSDIGRVICFNSIGKIYIVQEDYEAALPIINQALEKALKVNDQYYIASSYLNLGLIQLRKNNLEAAKTSLEKALTISEEYNLKTSKIEAYNYLSELFEKTGDLETALAYYKDHIKLEETVSNERNLQYVNDLIIKYESEKKNNQIKELASENEIVKLKLAQNRRTLILSLLGGVLIAIILFVLYRQRQLRNEKRIITLEQEMLRNQMNPHFIFNSLNSIKLYIINNEKENAVYYLNKFSKLIRKILVASTEKEISLEDELETMALYMNIENIRFSNEIEYQVDVAPEINSSIIKVPSLILQPFLENAIWHGLSTKPNNKKIHLSIERKDLNHVSISITDNGIGRDASQKIKNDKKLKRQSVGIDITKARLENFSKSFNDDYGLEIIDLYEDGRPSGTTVVLKIPTKN
ncbi:tetratricopeptide repeat-containing sensor histidine kinase [Hanstruepera neustonica]|nr:tetratricopeptide repeat protein [Hanstruepera neustonica]